MYALGNHAWEHELQGSESEEALALDFPTWIPCVPSGKIQSVSCGAKHIMVVIDGKLFGCGSNHHRQLHPQLPAVVDTLTRINLPLGSPKPKSVACGTYFSLVLCEDGTMLSCGLDDAGQCGQGKEYNAPAWRDVPLAAEIEQISVANECGAALTVNGEVYTWGTPKYGSLGHGTTGEFEAVEGGAPRFKIIRKPQRVQYFVTHRLRVKSISMAKEHFLAMTEKDVFVCGDGSYGKLGNNSTTPLLVPTKVAFAATHYSETLRAATAAPQGSFVVKHSPEMGAVVYYCGKLTSGDAYLDFRRVEGCPEDVVDVVAGQGFCYLLCASGKLWAWGAMPQGYSTSTLGATLESRQAKVRGQPILIDTLSAKSVMDVAVGRQMVVFVTDPSKLPDGSDKDPHVVVGRSNRYREFTARLSPNRYETATQQYVSRVAGDAAAELLEAIPEAPDVVITKVHIKKRQARNLGVGSKVRIWMEDVYALGTVAERDRKDKSENSFQIKWLREDWDDESVELFSDDETLNEENVSRWQNLWFLGEPVADDTAA